MSSVPVIQVLSKADYTKQHLVALPNAHPLPPLASDSIRVQTTIFSLSTNNFTYARMGHLVGWWDIHPLPPSIPIEFADSTKFGCISCWGYGTVLDSAVDSIPVSTRVYGYLPIGSLPVDLLVESNFNIEGHFFVRSPHRQHAWPIYNRYITVPPSVNGSTDGNEPALGYGALMQVLFETSYLLNRFVFTWEDTLSRPGQAGQVWTVEDANLQDAVVLLFAPSGKTALAMAHLLRHGRPSAHQPRKVIGVTSQGSRAFVQGTGLYDDVMQYGDITSADALQLIREDVGQDTKVVFIDFGGRGCATTTWSEALLPLCGQLRTVTVGSEVKHVSPDEATKAFKERAAAGGVMQANASDMRDRAMALLGERVYFGGFLEEWARFHERGGIKGLELVWGEGMESLYKAWDQLVKGEIGPDKGLLFTL